MPKKLSNYESGHFKSKALVRDLKNNKSNVVNLDVKAFDLDNLRLDVTSSIGTHVFSLVNRGQDVEYLVVSDKKHFTGRTSPKALAPIFTAPLDPKYLANIFFQKPIVDKNWTCDQNESGQLASCKELKTKMNISWEVNTDGSRLIRIVYPNVSLIQINVRDFSDSLKDRNDVLKLKVPKSFTTVVI